MIFAQLFVEFIFFSFLGWIWESIYCTAREHHWMDRGFLFGPYCPIYGSCVVGAEILFGYVLPGDLQEMSVPLVFIISMVGSAIAEYATSWVLEKRFHARWWDYSYMPFNLNGRICLPASIGFGLAGILCVKVLIPFMSGLHSEIPGLVYEGIAMVLAAVFGADFALTEASLNALLKRMEDYKAEFNAKAQETYVKISEAPEVIHTAIAEEREEIKERREARAEELRYRREEVAEELKRRREQILAKHSSGLSGFQQSKLKNMKRFVPELPEDLEAYEKLKEKVLNFKAK